MIPSRLRASAVLLVLLLPMASCGDRRLPCIAIDPAMDVFNPPPETGTIRRDFTCTAKGPNGECVQRECKQGPGGQEFDCTSYAAACVKAGFHWAGTSEGGKCSKVL